MQTADETLSEVSSLCCFTNHDTVNFPSHNCIYVRLALGTYTHINSKSFCLVHIISIYITQVISTLLIILAALFICTTTEKPMGKVCSDMNASTAMNFTTVHYGVNEQ